MKKILRALGFPFRQRWIMSLLGLFCILALIYFAGPLIPAVAGYQPLADYQIQLAVMSVVVAVWGLMQLLRWRRVRRDNNALLDSIADDPAAADRKASDEEIKLLASKMQEAMGLLRGARFGSSGGARLVSQLPWYLMIGPPGSGKTTALLHSGLRFPLSEQLGSAKLKGVGGTRYCDWFFTDEAVLIDTAGRYTTQDSHQAVDHATWLGFLDLLKQYRPRRPINGIIIAFSIDDLLKQSPAERELNARAVLARLRELRERLRVRIPVYVLLTKLDLVAGFTEMFEDLSREAREQVWGVTFPHHERADGATELREHVAGFPAAFDGLLSRLQKNLLPRLNELRDMQRRGMVLGFPMQLASARDLIGEFLNVLFDVSRFEEAPLLRGVYLTSGTQEGTPLDRIMSGIARGFGLNTQSPAGPGRAGRSYFLTNLVRRVIFAEAELAGVDWRRERQRRWTEAAALAGAAAVVVLMILGWMNSYHQNNLLLAAAQASTVAYRQTAAQSLTQPDPSPLAMLPALNALRDFPGGYSHRAESVPISMRLGLYQGDKIGDAAISAYTRALDSALLPRIATELEQQLQQNRDRPDYLFDALKAYLMLTDPSHLDRRLLRLWITLDWDKRFANVDSTQRQQLVQHLDALLDHGMTPPAANKILIATTQRILNQHSMADRAYLLLLGSSSDADQPPWRLTDHTPPTVTQVFRRHSGAPLSDALPGLYTKAGFQNFLLKRLPSLAQTMEREAWVLGTDSGASYTQADLDRLRHDVTQLYLTDYGKQWNDFVQDLELVPLNNLGQEVTELSLISGPDSPLSAVYEALAEQTTLRPQPDKASASDGGTIDLIEQRMKKLVQGTPLGAAVPGAGPPDDLMSLVDNRFADIATMIRRRGDQPAPMERIIALISELLVELNTELNAGPGGALANGNTPSMALQKVQLASAQQPGLMGKLLKQVAKEAAGTNAVLTSNQLQEAWRSQPARFCSDALSGRYPLNPNSSLDAGLADFGRFFGPNGMADDFARQNLKGFVDMSVHPWKPVAYGSNQAVVTRAGIQLLERTSLVRDAYFEGGSAQPSASFEVTPYDLDRQAGQSLLTLGGQTLTYDRSPPRMTRFQWPGPDGALSARIVLTSISDGHTAELTAQGPWAWFRLLDKGSIHPIAGRDVYEVTFTVGGMTATYTMRPGSAQNPFTLRDRGGFQCFDRL